jgi:hypothetical protein
MRNIYFPSQVPATVIKTLLAGSLLLTGCLNARKIDRQVARQYNDELPMLKKKQVDDIVITSAYTGADSKLSSTQSKTSNFLPLLVYWSWDYKNTCTLNPQIPLVNFTNTVHSYANKGLHQKLNGSRLELRVDSLPNKFALMDKAHLIFFGYAVGWDNVYLKAEPMNMVVTYKLLKDNQEMKNGIVSIPVLHDRQNLGMFRSWKRATQDYLDQYNSNIAAMSRMVVDKLAAEL